MSKQAAILLFLCAQAAYCAHALASDKLLKVTTAEENGAIHFYVHNLGAADITATFDFKLDNLKSSAKLPCTETIPGSETVEALVLTRVKTNAPWSYKYHDSYTVGSCLAVHDDSQLYSLPYEPGASFRVSQGYHGAFSHTGPDEYAVDWKMPLGTKVCAARGGVVVESKDDSNTGGPSRKFENDANRVLIRHSDGTIGIYAHLQQGGNRVRVGDMVNAGDWIALSGNTGFTSGPHLHFSVFKTRSGSERESIPVTFQTADGPVSSLITGRNYESLLPEPQVAGHPQVRTSSYCLRAGREQSGSD